MGWLERDDAVRYLTQSCIFDPPLTEAQAEVIWRPYRERCEALPEREAAAPSHIPLNHDERKHASLFMAAQARLGPQTIQDVIKIDLSRVVVHQLSIVATRSNDLYFSRVRTTTGWLHQALPLTPRPPAAFTWNLSVSANGLNTAVDFDIPHGEFVFAPDPTGQFFSVQQYQSYISVMRGPGTGSERMLLKAGYHRSYARVLSMMLPTATVPSAVVALERNTFLPPPNQAAAAGLTVATAGLRPNGRRPALFADFFDDALAMRVNLRRKRYQLQVRSTWVEIDA
ncbi:MAG: hypothetical protein WAQ52_13700 [Terriglobales bacterium]